ncbi:ABC transporter ATP-binding protein [Nakamurella aerolata]|uniref:ATP-binding cassette domain-containing protein n=1 Tax=Nakamurella aerolata TaxID=1656892 RepID=A0A849A7G9_9ACTN|nr:ATP-binding cassette domain-containing protein [Nakamurella aerolata]NNG34991.1 ATP-binding cassette domain-containing protein [Nakamurella aerolata]
MSEQVPAIEVDGLTRTFKVRRRGSLLRDVVTAVDDMSFTVQRGESVGYIGANGAGKSTTIKMLIGILVPSNGSARTCGLDPLQQRRRLARRIGVVFGQRSQLWWDLPVRESFAILGEIHRLPKAVARQRTEQLSEQLDMGEYWNTPVRQLSLGQRMRAEIGAALLHSPELLILDEPTIGLDVLSKQRLREFLIAERAEHGTTLLLTTHDMGDIERLCQRVLVVDHGRLAYDGSLPGLAATVDTRRILQIDLAEPTADLTGLGTATHLDSKGDGLRQRLAFDPKRVTVPQVLAEVSARAEVRDLSIEEPGIEEVVRKLYARRVP